jgi:dipeptidyl aminopeptidase/acylaminoacyl peptidase
MTQFYSFRWNFQLMAANGYIVVAPNRRGMPGTAWSGMNKSVKTGADR